MTDKHTNEVAVLTTELVDSVTKEFLSRAEQEVFPEEKILMKTDTTAKAIAESYRHLYSQNFDCLDYSAIISAFWALGVRTGLAAAEKTSLLKQANTPSTTTK